MKNRCYYSSAEKVIPVVYVFNLLNEPISVSSSSGCVENIEAGVKVVGGYIVKNKKEIIGWGCAFGNNEFHIYVRPHFRGFKIASKIIKRSKKDFPDYNYCPWNFETLNIFKKKKLKITKKYIPPQLWSLT